MQVHATTVAEIQCRTITVWCWKWPRTEPRRRPWWRAQTKSSTRVAAQKPCLPVTTIYDVL